MLRKKPVYIVKNAHSLLTANKDFEQNDSNRIPNGHLGNTIVISDGQQDNSIVLEF